VCGAFGDNVERGFWYPEQAVLADLLAKRGVGLPNSKEVGTIENEPGASLGDCWWIVSEEGERLVACVAKRKGEVGRFPVSIAFGQPEGVNDFCWRRGGGEASQFGELCAARAWRGFRFEGLPGVAGVQTARVGTKETGEFSVVGEETKRTCEIDRNAACFHEPQRSGLQTGSLASAAEKEVGVPEGCGAVGIIGVVGEQAS
jgi:hypothetical protein